jgi:hypothetical protein
MMTSLKFRSVPFQRPSSPLKARCQTGRPDEFEKNRPKCSYINTHLAKIIACVEKVARYFCSSIIFKKLPKVRNRKKAKNGEPLWLSGKMVE